MNCNEIYFNELSLIPLCQNLDEVEFRMKQYQSVLKVANKNME